MICIACRLSEDSNDEDNVANDYPDEESSDESVDESEYLDEVRTCKELTSALVQ